ncbi:MAG: M48 family metalloprotease [Pseudomonadota bacterium]
MSLPRSILLLATGLLLASAGARAVTQAEVMAGAAKIYRVRIAELAHAGMLSGDAAFLARVERIAQRLREQARRDDPDAPAMPWEINVSTDADDNGSCMAGGLIVLSQDYVERLKLTDAELAMLLSHEMQHAILLHNLKEFEEAIRLEPSWLARPFSELEDAVDNNLRLETKLAASNKAQEVQADRAGLAMAWRAGWPAMALTGYFRKLADARSMTSWGSSATHPSPLQRLRAARKQAELLDVGNVGVPKPQAP